MSHSAQLDKIFQRLDKNNRFHPPPHVSYHTHWALPFPNTHITDSDLVKGSGYMVAVSLQTSEIETSKNCDGGWRSGSSGRALA
jgi:hypothetical protein